MPQTLEPARLHVEGDDDKHSVIHLLIRHGVAYDAQPWPQDLPLLEEAKGITKLLDTMDTAIRLSTGRVVGFILDADSPLSDRWNAVRARLIAASVDNVPATPPVEGFAGTSTKYRATVGVWLMPDNQQDGKLEDFLRGLIDEQNLLINHATSATDAATVLGATFSSADRIKAIIHAWLAWQNEPGLPYGTAMKARYFLHDTATSKRFVHWFKTLYRVS